MSRRLLVVSQYFWPETFGINTLVAKLTDLGCEITVLTGKPNYPSGKIFPGYTAWGLQRERYGKVDILRVPMLPRGEKSTFGLVANYLSFVIAGYFFAPFFLRSRRFDGVFVYAPSPLLQALPAILLARLKKSPLVVWVQDLWPESLLATGFVKNQWLLALTARVVRHIYSKCDLVLIQSEGFREPVIRAGADPSKVRYFPNAVDLGAGAQDDASTEAKALAARMKGSFSVVFAGNLGTAQSLETIVGAAALLRERRDIRFYLVGSGSRSDWLQSEVANRNLDNIILSGRFSPKDMPLIYSASSALLVSLRNEPIFAYTIPSKLQSCLAAGRPIIASLNGEGARIVSEAGAGVTCPAGNFMALAGAVLGLSLNNSSEREQMGANGRRYAAEHFDLDHLTTELLCRLDRLAAEHEVKRN